MTTSRSILGATLVLLASAACSSEEAPRVSLPVLVDGSGLTPVTTDLGYVVVLSQARAALRDVELTVGGEAHARRVRPSGGRWTSWLVGTAHAHPGHQAGGEVIGELPGPLVVDWTRDGASLGTASLVTGRYRGANFFFRRASAAELPAGDPLVGHTFALQGTASRDGRTVAFSAVLDMDENTQLVGAPFDVQVKSDQPRALGMRLLPADPSTAGQTVFNQVDFFALAGAAEQVAIVPGQPAHNVLFRTLQVHDHYDIKPR